jgi:hypothetical protein
MLRARFEIALDQKVYGRTQPVSDFLGVPSRDEAYVNPEAESKDGVFPQDVEGKSNSFCSSCSESRCVVVPQAREEEKVKDYD